MVCLNFTNFAEVIYQPLKFTIMKKDFKIKDFWLYIAQIQEEVTQEVVKQVTEDEYFPCVRTITDYMFCLRAMHLNKIWAMNRSGNKYIDLINEALKKRSILISEFYIHISNIKHKGNGEED